MQLSDSIEQIPRAGKVMATKLKNLGLLTVEDLLGYWPFRYDDFSLTTPIGDLVAPTRANIVGEVAMISNKRSFRRKMAITEALIMDDSGTARAVWFNQPFLVRNLKVGDRVSMSGKVEEEYGSPLMQSPVYEKIHTPTSGHPSQEGNKDPSLSLPTSDPLLTSPLVRGREIMDVRGGELRGVHTQGLVPNYNLTANLTQKQLRFLVSQVIGLAKTLPDYLPGSIKKDYGLIDLARAIYQIHFPKNQAEIDGAKKRLAFDELFLLQLRSQIIRRELKHLSAPAIIFQEALTKNFVADLPFALTIDQRKSAWEIIQDLGRTTPMTRLLEGDVGSGKTLVALLAMINVASNNWQSALLVPTEILAKQHFNTLSKLLTGTKFRVGLITRTDKRMNVELALTSDPLPTSPTSDPSPTLPLVRGGRLKECGGRKKVEIIKAKKITVDEITANADIIIGTHALIQEKIKFRNLALVVVDEQHRFGVNQRQALITHTGGADFAPHLLSMTATPIPRSLALALYDDLALSIIKTMPVGRIPVATRIFKDSERNEAYDLIRAEIAKGHQAFVVCPLIEESEVLEIKSAKAEYDKLTKGVFSDLVVGLVHGKLKPKDKEQVMSDFVDNKINILVATAVVEVGVDVPNATVMMIESADRFGLASLHQYRGRVGRSAEQSYCLLLTEEAGDPTSPKGFDGASKAKERLEAILKFDNGFDLAKVDLKFRGPGEVYGTVQKGFPELKLASLFDFALMNQARTASLKILDASPDLAKFVALKAKLGEGEGTNVHLE